MSISNIRTATWRKVFSHQVYQERQESRKNTVCARSVMWGRLPLVPYPCMMVSSRLHPCHTNRNTQLAYSAVNFPTEEITGLFSHKFPFRKRYFFLVPSETCKASNNPLIFLSHLSWPVSIEMLHDLSVQNIMSVVDTALTTHVAYDKKTLPERCVTGLLSLIQQSSPGSYRLFWSFQLTMYRDLHYLLIKCVDVEVITSIPFL